MVLFDTSPFTNVEVSVSAVEGAPTGVEESGIGMEPRGEDDHDAFLDCGSLSPILEASVALESLRDKDGGAILHRAKT